MLEQVLGHIHNWFQLGIYDGTYAIQGGKITLPFLQDGQYFRIVGSVFNNGLHRYGPEIDLQDETFSGAVWALAVPRAVIELATDIDDWQKKYGEITASPYSSESFGGYSYTKSGGANENGGSGGWQAAFRGRLNQWRKLRDV